MIGGASGGARAENIGERSSLKQSSNVDKERGIKHSKNSKQPKARLVSRLAHPFRKEESQSTNVSSLTCGSPPKH